MSNQITLTVICPDGIKRKAQITSRKDSRTYLSVRQGGTRYTGYLVNGCKFKATVGENGNPWQWLNVRHPELMPVCTKNIAKQETITVQCPDGMTRNAQITSAGGYRKLSVRVGGRRFAGALAEEDGINYFVPTNGKNGNVFRYLA